MTLSVAKPFYRIGEVSQIVGVQPHVLRYWETEFRTIRPEKSNKGQRVYSRKDVEKLLRVKDLLRNQGFTIAGARKRLREATPAVHAPPSSAPEALNMDRQDPVGKAAAVAQARAAALVAGAPGGAKGLRRALVALRSDILKMMSELADTGGRPDAASIAKPQRAARSVSSGPTNG